MKRVAICAYAAVAVALLIWGYYQAIYVSPVDAMQGEIYRIIFYHVPLWMCTFLFFAISFLGSVFFLVWRRSRPDLAQHADAWALSGAEVGVLCCTNALILGSMWGRRAWGIWWTWDARLTTTLIMWLIYMSYLLLRRFAAGIQMQTQAAVLGIFGALDMPIVYMSNRWWRTQHPAPVFGGAPGAGMDKSMLVPFGWNSLAWVAWGVLVFILRYQYERKRQQLQAEEVQRALGEPTGYRTDLVQR
jgi:heme exporter protein C